MIVLVYYFLSNSRNFFSGKHFVTAALALSWIGDVVLLLEKIYRPLFVIGLLSFLLAHIFYVIFFLKLRKRNPAVLRAKPLVTFFVLVYTGVMYFTLLPHIESMKLPVLAYCLVISLMLITSFHAFDMRNQVFGQVCVVGTLLFALSDSILAINRFYYPFAVGSSLVIFTYALGQLLITEGVLVGLKTLNLKRQNPPFA